ncbi:MAG TPA: hypothetical protein VHZ24_00825 [Pirellulales bacterium]|jgi:hypothetical protein|nr:hypothetical protein [Pirellulales bacterium]
MDAEELRDVGRSRPFEPFRIVLTDGQTYDIRHPDLLWVGRKMAYVGLTGDPGQVFFERSVRVDLLHVTRTEPLAGDSPKGSNGSPPPGAA